MSDNLPVLEFISYLARIKEDGSGLSHDEAKRFLLMLSDPAFGVRSKVDNLAWRRANMLAPFVRRRLEAGKPPKT